MYTAVGLRFLATLAKRGERVPAYLLPAAEDRGAAHLNAPKPAGQRDETAHRRNPAG